MRLGLLKPLVLASLAVALLLGAVTEAMAATRYAAPEASGPEPCEQSNPCSLFGAADASSGIQPGDEVVVEPGEYAEADLGSKLAISLPHGVSLHGRAGARRPVLLIANVEERQEFIPGLRATAEDTVSHILLNTNIPFPLVSEGAAISDVVVRSTHPEALSCVVSGGAIRDSACISTGFQGVALGDRPLLSSNRNVDLRNVTAASFGEESRGIEFAVSGSSVGAGTLTATATNVIAVGGSAAVSAIASNGASVEVNLDHSDYDKTSTGVFNNGVSATVSPTGPGTTNITAEPIFDRDGYHQLPESPTIDGGVADALTGAVDIDGQPRVFGAALDIGADEWFFERPEVQEEEIRLPVRRPQTWFRKHPSRRTHARDARFSLISDRALARFECKLDARPFLRCPPRFVVRVRGGAHVLRVRAVDFTGERDPTPAVFRWKVSAR